jgi:glyoxylase-like metal-dependent hydrolase (beta-lactamase superfamily II)
METRFGPLLFICGMNSGKYPYCHSLFVEAASKVIIDPGSDRGRLLQLRESPGVDAVWLSHSHEDHFKDLDLFEDKDLWVAKLEAHSLENLDNFFDAYGMTSKERQFYQEAMVHDFHFKPRFADRLFGEEEVIDLGGITVDVIPTPGHTPGHCSFYFQELRILFLGDYDLTSFGPWYGDAKSDIEATIASVNRLRSISAKVWIASHESGVFESEPGDLWDHYLNTIDEREAKLLDLLRTPRTMPEIVEARILYGKKREPQEMYDIGERGHMTKHIERLMGRGIVVLEDDTYRLT